MTMKHWKLDVSLEISFGLTVVLSASCMDMHAKAAWEIDEQ